MRNGARFRPRDRLQVEAHKVLLLVTNDAHKKGMDKAIEAIRIAP